MNARSTAARKSIVDSGQPRSWVDWPLVQIPSNIEQWKKVAAQLNLLVFLFNEFC